MLKLAAIPQTARRVTVCDGSVPQCLLTIIPSDRHPVLQYLSTAIPFYRKTYLEQSETFWFPNLSTAIPTDFDNYHPPNQHAY